jgi:hypothetical protein
MHLQKNGMVKPLGKGFTIIECEGVDINTPENAKIIEEIVSTAKKIRGDVISKSLEVDFFLNEIIGFFFMGDNKKQTDIFNDCILHKEFFTLWEKMKVLSFLLENYPERFHLESTKKRKEIITIIRKVIEYRNKFAHEEIVVNFREKTAYILDNKQNNLLSPELIDEFHHQISHLSLVYMTLFVNLIIEFEKGYPTPKRSSD